MTHRLSVQKTKKGKYNRIVCVSSTRNTFKLQQLANAEHQTAFIHAHFFFSLRPFSDVISLTMEKRSGEKGTSVWVQDDAHIPDNDYNHILCVCVCVFYAKAHFAGIKFYIVFSLCSTPHSHLFFSSSFCFSFCIFVCVLLFQVVFSLFYRHIWSNIAFH